MADSPTTIANQVLDQIGIDFTLGDIEEGTRQAQVMLRSYRQCFQQLARAAHWDNFRKQAPLQLLADATQQTPNVGTVVPYGFLYEYAYPGDCLKVRYIPWNISNLAVPQGNTYLPPNTPLYAGEVQTSGQLCGPRPARFLVTADTNNNPYVPGVPPVHGISPIANLVVLTNVKCASAIYTMDNPYPTMWDPQFRAAFVAYLAAEVVMALHEDKKFAVSLRNQQMMIAKQKVDAARISDGNEGWANSDLSVDWMNFRNTGGGGIGFADSGIGVYGYGYDTGVFGLGNTGAY